MIKGVNVTWLEDGTKLRIRLSIENNNYK